ncbi:hypothetical protein WI23_08855 [Burkholderia oklahomensis C6786]|nr:hypothetical protein WI23_08855 [Burkholderia oklahomensis C6786]KUY52865.1 hypothetical protein WI23_23715 [Burkholderia oklahomensis C6786]
MRAWIAASGIARWRTHVLRVGKLDRTVPVARSKMLAWDLRTRWRTLKILKSIVTKHNHIFLK